VCSSDLVGASIVQAPSQQYAIAGRNLTIIGTVPAQESYAVAVRKGDTELLATLDRGLVRLKGDPYWQQIREKHGIA
jgi:ABC-type amino acid transport substrate-binding protein